MVGVEPAGECVDLTFWDIAQDRQAAVHIAIERAVADGQFAFVAGCEDECAGSI